MKVGKSKSNSYIDTDDGMKTLEEFTCDSHHFIFKERRALDSPQGFMTGECSKCNITHKEYLLEKIKSDDYPKLPNGDFDMKHKLIKHADTTVLKIIEKIRKEKSFI